MKHLLSATVMSLLLATGAHAQSMGEKTGINSMVGKAPTTQDFVTEAAQSDMFELQSNQLAQSKGGEKEKTFAAKMIADHTKTTTDIKAMLADGKVKATAPTAMTSGQQSMLDKLKGLNGGDFNKQFWSDQESAHKDAVSLFQRYSDGGDNDGLKTWTKVTLPVLQGHLKMAQDNNK